MKRLFPRLMLLMTAFTLTFSFASCGDDDDDTPAGDNQQQTAGISELKMGDKTLTFNAASGSFDAQLKSIQITFGLEEGEQYCVFQLVLLNVEPANGRIPTGSYPLYNTTEGDVPSYAVSGVMRSETELCYLEADDQSGNVKIERNGDTYTIKIEKLALILNDRAAENPITVNSSFSYKGKLDIANR